MKKYSIAINSIVFLISLIIGISIINTTLNPNDFTKTNPGLRIIDAGEIIQILPHSLIFEYLHEGYTWKIEIEITDDTTFHESKVLSEDGIIYGREIKEINYNKLSTGKRVVVDWEFIDKRGFVATDIIMVDSELSNLLY